MTAEQEILSDALESARRIRARLLKSAAHFGEEALSASALTDMTDGVREKLDAFLKRFEQLYDAVSRRAFRAALVVAGDDVRRMSFRDALNRLEALELIEDQNLWINAGSARNKLTHDYPLNAEKQVAAINPALLLARPLIAAFDAFEAAVRARKLLEDQT